MPSFIAHGPLLPDELVQDLEDDRVVLFCGAGLPDYTQRRAAARRTIQGFEAMLWLRKGFGFAGAWTVCEQNRLLALCFGLPEVNKV